MAELFQLGAAPIVSPEERCCWTSHPGYAYQDFRGENLDLVLLGLVLPEDALAQSPLDERGKRDRHYVDQMVERLGMHSDLPSLVDRANALREAGRDSSSKPRRLQA
jgi:hypothetical protein